LPNVFKSQSVFVNHKTPFVPERKPKALCQDISVNMPDATDKINAAEVVIANMLKKAEMEAYDIINSVKLEAQEILTKSITHSDNIKEEAKLKGYEEGYYHGLKSAKEECISLLDEILSIRAQIIDERTTLYYAFEQDLVKLSLEISKKVIYEHLSEDDEAFVKLVQSTVQKVRGVDFAKIWVSPANHAKLSDLRESLLSGLKGIKDVEILRGESIKNWGCIIDTESGVLDGGVDTRVTQIKEVLFASNEEFTL